MVLRASAAMQTQPPEAHEALQGEFISTASPHMEEIVDSANPHPPGGAYRNQHLTFTRSQIKWFGVVFEIKSALKAYNRNLFQTARRHRPAGAVCDPAALG
jgi:hypothetical protein